MLGRKPLWIFLFLFLCGPVGSSPLFSHPEVLEELEVHFQGLDQRFGELQDFHPELAERLRWVREYFLERFHNDLQRSRELLLILNHFSQIRFDHPAELYDFFRQSHLLIQQLEADTHGPLLELKRATVALRAEHLAAIYEDFFVGELYTEPSRVEEGAPFYFDLSQIQDVFSWFVEGSDFVFDVDIGSDFTRPPLFTPGRLREVLFPIFVDSLQSSQTIEDYIQLAELRFPRSSLWQEFRQQSIRASLVSFAKLEPLPGDSRRVLRGAFFGQSRDEDFESVRQSLLESLSRSARPQHRRLAMEISQFDKDSEPLFYLSLILAKTKFDSLTELLDFYDQDVKEFFRTSGSALPEEAIVLMMLRWMADASHVLSSEFDTVSTQRFLALPLELDRIWIQSDESRKPDSAFADFSRDPARVYPEFRLNTLASSTYQLAAHQMRRAQSAEELVQVARFRVIQSRDLVGIKNRLLLEFVPLLIERGADFQKFVEYLTGVPDVNEEKLGQAFQKISKAEISVSEKNSSLVKLGLLLKWIQDSRDLSMDRAQSGRVKNDLSELVVTMIVELFSLRVEISSDAEKLAIESSVLSFLPKKVRDRIVFRSRRNRFQLENGCEALIRAARSIQKSSRK